MNNTLNASKDGVSYSIFKVSPETYQSLIKKINSSNIKSFKVMKLMY